MKRSLLCGAMLLLAAIFTCGQVWGAKNEYYYVVPVAYEAAGGDPQFLMKNQYFQDVEPLVFSDKDIEKKDNIVADHLNFFKGAVYIEEFVVIDLKEFNTYLILFKEKYGIENNNYRWSSFDELKKNIIEEYKQWLGNQWMLSDNTKGDLLKKTKNAVANNCVILKCFYRYVDKTDLLGVAFSNAGGEKNFYTSGTDPVSMSTYSIENYGKALKDKWFRFYHRNSFESFFCRAFVFAWDGVKHKDENILWFKLDTITSEKPEQKYATYQVPTWRMEKEGIHAGNNEKISYNVYQALNSIAKSFKDDGLDGAKKEQLKKEAEQKQQEQIAKDLELARQLQEEEQRLAAEEEKKNLAALELANQKEQQELKEQQAAEQKKLQEKLDKEKDEQKKQELKKEKEALDLKNKQDQEELKRKSDEAKQKVKAGAQKKQEEKNPVVLLAESLKRLSQKS